MWLAEKTGADNYSRVVDEALKNESIFNTFKIHDNYRCIVGLPNESQGQVWYEYIKQYRQDLFEKLDIYKQNDKFGSPPLWTSNDGITIAPGTLRYLYTVVDVQKHFNLPSPIKIAELGVGYGGLAFMFLNTLDVKEYCLLDLPNVQALAQKYLNALGMKNHVTEFTGCDLFISEFCLSEFSDEGIDTFYQKYMLNSKYIYLFMNLHEEDRKERFLKKISVDFDLTVKPEFPESAWPNYMVIGTKK